MGVVLARLVFLAFLGLTGTIIYNALYLQDQHGPAPISATSPARVITSTAAPTAPVEINKLPPVTTDLPPPPPPAQAAEGAPELLVKAVQRELSVRGYDVGTTDGKLNDKTRAAISAYEASEGLPATGQASDELLHHILLGDSVKPSAATGSLTDDDEAPARAPAKAKSDNSDKDAADPSVKAVQQILADLGYAPGAVDGAMGAATTHAITAFQHDRKLRETGRISPELMRELKRVTGRAVAKTAAKP
jgi:peptidoglycan hydrolase-like protein with peptidoglycan-binding domain